MMNTERFLTYLYSSLPLRGFYSLAVLHFLFVSPHVLFYLFLSTFPFATRRFLDTSTITETTRWVLSSLLVANQHVYIKSVTENINCCKHWDSLYKEILEASVAVLKRLVGEWKEHSVKISSSPSNALTLNRTMKSFMLKNEEAITEGAANGSLCREADKSCKVISGRLSGGSGCLKGTAIIAVVLAAAAVLYSNHDEATTELKNLVDSLDTNHLNFCKY